MARLRHWWIALSLVVLLAPRATAASIPSTQAYSLLLADHRTGEILFSKNSGETTYIASITKLMTAILLVESGRLDQEFLVSPQAASTPAISLYAAPGERLPGHELLQALLIMSANDAAVVVAEGLAGAVEEFATQMTERAHSLGAKHTFFSNPHGLHSEGHVSTAHDVLLITRHALSLPAIRETAGMREAYLASMGRTIASTNPLLDSYPGAIGLKTGFTRAAGSCLVGVAARGELELIAIILGAPLGTAGAEAAVLLDYGFALYADHQVVQAGSILGSAAVDRSLQEIDLVAGASISLMIRDPALIHTSMDIIPLNAPLHDGDPLGEMHIHYAGAHLATVPVLAQGEALIAWYYRHEVWGAVGLAGMTLVWRRARQRQRRRARRQAHWMLMRQRYYS